MKLFVHKSRTVKGVRQDFLTEVSQEDFLRACLSTQRHVSLVLDERERLVGFTTSAVEPKENQRIEWVIRKGPTFTAERKAVGYFVP